MAKAKVAAKGKAKAAKKWSKGKVKDKAVHAVVLTEALIQKIDSDVLPMRLITPSSLIERLKINGSVARYVIKALEKDGKIKRVVHHHSQLIYTRNTTKGGSD